MRLFALVTFYVILILNLACASVVQGWKRWDRITEVIFTPGLWVN